jgi:chromosome segregation ATPase
MGTNATELAIETGIEGEALRIGKPALEDRTPDAAGSEDFALAPLVDKIAYGIARGLVVAMKELENHIANETRKVGDSVDRRLDILQASLQELSNFVMEQRSTNIAVQKQVRELTADLRETDARHAVAAEGIRREAQEFSASVTQKIDETGAALRESDARLQDQTNALSQSVSERIDGLCRELGVQQEDVAAIKGALCNFSARVEALVARLDRQAEAVRSMYAAYSQRETELEQVVDGLARLRAFPTPLPSNGL